ncbi:hypothetical protein BDW74DRAFT_170142 [Aspergillus multicolor]|uniref:uncharacterized protein n=1 Tax=Aspergillus multicolor TaxID=41759 RepID=UPI003CCCCB57
MTNASPLPSLASCSPTTTPQALLLSDAPLLLHHPYLPLDSGYALTLDGMHYITASTYMRGCSGAMVYAWFGCVRSTEQYKLWHPTDHVYSEWRETASFVNPGMFFEPDWENNFRETGYSTAIYARIGDWNDEDDSIGDVEGVTDPVERAKLVSEGMCVGLLKHATEEMAILAERLPGLYADFGGEKGTAE